MRWFCVSLLLAVLSLAVVVSAGWPSAAQDKTFAVSILVEHNNVRQKYNVQLLIWDDGLAKLAQDWANKIAASGAIPPPHRASGQNLFWGTADQWPVKDVLEVWEAESKNYDRATNTCAPGKNCVHFTQVVWHTTTRVGCGIAKGMSKGELTDFIACDYSPPGNYVGQSPFPPAIATTTPVASPTQIARVIPPEPTPAPPVATPTPVARVITPAVPLPNTNASCEDLRKIVPQLTAEVEQLKKQNPEYAKLATPTPTPPPLDPNAKCPTNKYGIEFLPIPGKSFCMGKYEVTQAQWKSVMGADNNPSNFDDCGGNCPVEQVDWDEAQDFINELNESNDGFKYRLPTGAEFEYSFRAGTTGRYYGEVSGIGWHKHNSGGLTHPVGGKQPNAFGLYDMAGNVWEWCQDWYDEDEGLRMLRGGSWHSKRYSLASAQKSGIAPDDYEDYVGFRVLAERPATIAEASTPTPTPLPVARQIILGATPTPTATPAATPDTNAECEELRKTVQELTAQVEQLKRPTPPRDPAAKCPTIKYGIEFLPIPAVQPFCLGKYEVTQAQWKLVMGDNPSYFKDCGGKCPVERVSWDDAQSFINKLNASNDGFKYRLPADAEWEFACRARTTGKYYGDVEEIAWHRRNSDAKTHAVGGKLPNAFGLYDMSGNVSEWCQDWFDNRIQYERARRGGSWHSFTEDLRSGTRIGSEPDARRNYIGFRVAAVRAP